MRTDALILRHSQGLATPYRPHHYRVLDGKRRHVQGIQQAFKRRFVLHVVQHFCQAHQADAVHVLNNERIKIVPPLFTVADHIDPNLFLQGHGLLHRLGRHAVELCRAEASCLFAT